MGLVTHMINERVQVASGNREDMQPGIWTLIEDYIIPIYTKYDNISYLGQYKNGNECKYVLDIGYDNIAYCLYVNNSYLYTGLCDKKDIDNFDKLAGSFTGTDNTKRYTLSTKNIDDKYYEVFDGVIRILAHGNEAKVIIAPSKADICSQQKAIMDVDSFGNKYIAYCSESTGSLSMFYDTDDLLEGSVSTSSIVNALDMQVLIGQPSLIKSSVFTGLGTNLVDIKNNAIETELTLIDVEGVRYRNIAKYRWYKEEE